MSMDKPVRIGLVGLGTVGQGVIRLLKDNAEVITGRLGRPLRVVAATARDLGKPRDCDLRGIRLLNTPQAVVDDAEVDIVVELIGGTTVAKDLVLAALAAGKPVVTANKALLALEGNTVFAAARKAGVALGFEAAVAGGIPVIKTLREGLAGNQVQQVAGIINGTCNYILTQMSQRGQAFADALADAQRLGYAEADPSFDVDGIDAAHKLTLLASLAFGMPLAFADMAVEGIRKVGVEDIRIAAALGYRIKHLGIAKRSDGEVELRVHPTLIPEDHLLAKVDGVLNSVLLHGNGSGPIGLYGAGAGGNATASAVIADLVDLARQIGGGARVPDLGFLPDAIHALPVRALAETESAFYLRLRVADEPGVLKGITSIFAELDISIEAIQQREPRESADATVALITSVAPERVIADAVRRIEALPYVREQAARLRVEHFN
jgi:homoserine dehydrogenase